MLYEVITGDAALLEYTAKFDRVAARGMAELELPRSRLEAALAALPATERDALDSAAARVRAFHERQRAQSWEYIDAEGTRLGQRVSPIERVGVYVPGGKAAYPSTVLMNVIPAKVAGVGEIVMASPVITSYSIHYTKLYEGGRRARLRGATWAAPARPCCAPRRGQTLPCTRAAPRRRARAPRR